MKKLSNVTLVGIDCVDVERIQKALDISSKDIQFAEVKLLTSLSTDDVRKVEIPPINTVEEFSEFCIKDLHKYVDTDYVLLVQHDGFILNLESWEDEFLQYDYIGAPWFIYEEFWFELFDLPRELFDTLVVGNGGFSLRSKKFLEKSAELANKNIFKKYHPEDLMLCVWNRKEMEEVGIKFAPADVAARFSVEGDYRDLLNAKLAPYDKQFGFHGLKWTDISKWIEQNPQYGIVNDLRINKIKKNEESI